MRFSTRRAAPAATYAAIIDDRVLWVALAEPAGVALVPAAGGAPIGPSGLDDTQVGHHGVRFDLTSLPTAPSAYALQAERGRALLGPPVRPVPAGAEFALTRDDDTALHVVRRAREAAATLRAVRLLGDRVQLVLDLPEDSRGELRLVDGDAFGVGLPITRPSGTVIIGAADLARLAPGERTVRLLVDDRPVRRRAGDLADPGPGVPLPAVHAFGAPAPRARLRWSSDGTLVLRLIQAAR